ncbi:MAG: type IV pilus twitching motility protein PilT [Clostridia bacterium]|nr:type IV pilus twitching motility protein PilT [Clostridia bacterium]
MLDYSMKNLLKASIDFKASDLHITVGVPPMLRITGTFKRYPKDPLTAEDTETLVKQILSPEQFAKLKKVGEVDCCIAFAGNRFRINAYSQKGCYAAALRTINNTMRSFKELGLPDVFYNLCQKTRGLILVTGPTGSGKSTTLASMIDKMNTDRSAHIITLEDPIEYYHNHKKCIVNQREIGQDTMSFANALRAALRQDPDIIQVGEMRDLETISTALTAAETGHLVMSTLHTIGAASTIDRVVDVFPAYQQQQIRVQLANVLQAVISQQLIVKADGSGRVAALEIMLASPAINALIREGKTHQMNNTILTSSQMGMQLMDDSLAKLYKAGTISYEQAFMHSVDQEYFKRKAAEKM